MSFSLFGEDFLSDIIEDLERQIYDASYPYNDAIEPLARWQGLRDLGGEMEGILIPLDNDGNLEQQRRGLTRWAVSFSSFFEIHQNDAAVMAIAYVARQLDGKNFLLNQQTDKTRQAEGDKLLLLASRFEEKGFSKEAEIFRQVSRALSGEASTQKIADFLRKVNAAFYIDTAVNALLWIRQDARLWAAKVAGETGYPVDEVLEKGCRAARLLAANAYGNNHQHIPDYLWEYLLCPLIEDEKRTLMSPDHFAQSLEKAKNAQPSCDVTGKTFKRMKGATGQAVGPTVDNKLKL